MLSVQNLAVARGGVPILEGISFELAKGEALILRGPNGSGKTTLLRTLAGLQPPLAGQVSCADDSIAYAAHSDGLKANLSVMENLSFWASVFGTNLAEKALSGFQLDALQSRHAHALSAGQKRRLGLARLLVTGRPIWVLDEPTVSLDKDAVAMFADVVAQHLHSGGAAIIATHIDLGLEARSLDVAPYKAKADSLLSAFDEGFL